MDIPPRGDRRRPNRKVRFDSRAAVKYTLHKIRAFATDRHKPFTIKVI